MKKWTKLQKVIPANPAASFVVKKRRHRVTPSIRSVTDWMLLNIVENLNVVTSILLCRRLRLR